MLPKNALCETSIDRQVPSPKTTDAPDGRFELSQPISSFTYMDWKLKVLKDMSNLDQDPVQASALSKRGF